MARSWWDSEGQSRTEDGGLAERATGPAQRGGDRRCRPQSVVCGACLSVVRLFPRRPVSSYPSGVTGSGKSGSGKNAPPPPPRPSPRREAPPERTHSSVPCGRSGSLHRAGAPASQAGGGCRGRRGRVRPPGPAARTASGRWAQGSLAAALKTCGLGKILVDSSWPKPVSEREASGRGPRPGLPPGPRATVAAGVGLKTRLSTRPFGGCDAVGTPGGVAASFLPRER